MVRKKKSVYDVLISEDKQYVKNQKCPVDNKTTLLYSQAIGHDKIDELLTELAETLKYAEENKIDYPSNTLHVIEYLQYLCFKYFTNLEEALDSKDYETNIVAFRNAYKKGWMQKVLNELDVNEYGKVFDRFYETIENTAKIANLQEKSKQELLNTIQNKEVLNMVNSRNVRMN